jgi:hypothetical protein
MPAPKLGRLKKVELRTAWQNEASDFTPWLAGEENIRLLGDTLGLDLEVQQQEAQVGPFRADILCRNTADNTLVLVENQLERTDHGHLGQLFTYAAGLDAVTVVWIASRFTEEHRAAIDWLNRITHDGFHFFGLEIELWRIGTSEPAPKFNVVAKPNDWSKVVAEVRSGGRQLTPGQEKQVAFWADFGKVIEETDSHWKVPKPAVTSWVGYGIGRGGFGLYPTVSVNAEWVAVRVAMNDDYSEAHFHLLQEDREAIEAELGFKPDWLEKPGRKESTIEVRRAGKLYVEEDRRALFVWMLDKMDDLDRVLRPRIKDLDATDWTPAGADDD